MCALPIAGRVVVLARFWWLIECSEGPLPSVVPAHEYKASIVLSQCDLPRQIVARRCKSVPMTPGGPAFSGRPMGQR